jgi:hypothetical protein
MDISKLTNSIVMTFVGLIIVFSLAVAFLPTLLESAETLANLSGLPAGFATIFSIVVPIAVVVGVLLLILKMATGGHNK